METNRVSLSEWMDFFWDKINKNRQILIVTALAVIVFGAIIFGYVYYKDKQRCNAYKDFLIAMQYYDGIVKSKDSESNYPGARYFSTHDEKWQQTEQVFRQGYEKHKNTEMAPIFLAFQSEALINLGKVEQAMQNLNSVVAQLKIQDLKDCYKVKLALIKMDLNDESLLKQGLSELTAIANSDGCAASEIALYHAGAYFWNSKKYEEAKGYWQRLLVKTTAKAGQTSVFAPEVREKLSLISTENV